MNVLIVDDSTLIQESLSNILSVMNGINVIAKAQDVESAVFIARERRPDVLILDIKLDGESGIEVLKEVKKQNPAPKVIVLTNYPYSQYRKKCIEEGADYFLDKSAEFGEIAKIFDGLLKLEIDTKNAAL